MKKNSKLFVFFVLVMACILCCPLFSHQVFAENQTQIVEINIQSTEDLKKIGKDSSFPLSNVKYVLQSDIIFENDDFEPLGEFRGRFDGNGYKIKGLKFKDSGYEIGLFSSTKNATIKNLALEDLSIVRKNVVPDVANSNVAVYVGGVAGKMENTIIENCYVTFKNTSSSNVMTIYDEEDINADGDDLENVNELSGTTDFYFGGLAGEMTLGCSVKNCFSNVYMKICQTGSQNSSIIAGGLCGNYVSSSIVNCFSYGNLYCNQIPDETIESSLETNLGGIAGFVSGYNSKIVNTYFSGELVSSNNAVTPIAHIGGTIGKITTISSLTPKSGNINFCYALAKNEASISNFGVQNNYSIENLQIETLQQENFALFEIESSWSEFEPWDFKYTFTSHLDGFPTLQYFNKYEINLNENKTIIDLGDGIQNDVKPATLKFVGEGDAAQKVFKFNDKIEILIDVTENFKNYYSLSYVLINNSIVCTINEQNEVFSLTSDSEDGSYLLSYYINDQTHGDVSVALEKLQYQAIVKTDNSMMGKVRNQFSVTTYENFEQNLSNGNMYRFFAVPINSNFAFSKWVVETIENEETVVTELEDFSSSQLSFRFGMNDETPLTELICNGGKLSAVFSSNICKINIECKLSNGDVDNNAGKIFVEVDGVKTEVKDLSVVKGKEVKLSYEVNDGYKFVEWLDENNRRLSSEEVCMINTEDDSLIVFARFEKIEGGKNLLGLWITLGIIGGLLLIGGIVWIIVAKRKDNSYKNFY